LNPVVDIEWLQANAASVVLADVRWYLDGRSGRAAYAAGHLPGAVFVDLDRWLAAAPSPAEGRHPLPDPEVFAAGMRELGIGDDDAVVAYDDAGGAVAARLVWMLRATGHPAALLDGGLGAYDGELAREPELRPPAAFTARAWPSDLLASIDDAADPANRVLDARAPERYRGEVEPVDAVAGHIPGAENVPAASLLGDDGRLLARDELRARLEGADVAYCGSGVNASFLVVAAQHAGLPAPRLYPGSWSQWSGDPRRPVERDSRPAADPDAR
jgi:thiosulfate/3-mercaptopyruvate sulfurtransferase